MNKLLNIFLLVVSSSIWCLSHDLRAAANDVPLAPIQPQQQQQQTPPLRNIEIIKDIKVFIQKNPHLRLLRLNKKKPLNRSQSVKYTLGDRVSGDRLVAQYADSFFYTAPTNVSHQVTYNENNTSSAVVTAVDINCLQDKEDGNAYILAGGIGQRFISIILEAIETERFSYNLHVFGKN